MINLVVCVAGNLFRLYLIYKYIKIFVEGGVGGEE